MHNTYFKYICVNFIIMAFSLSAIQTAFATHLTNIGLTNTEKATRDALLPESAFPTVITVNSDYTTVATAQATFVTAYATAQTAYATAVSNQRNSELGVISAIVTATTTSTMPPLGADQWYVHSDGTHWFGYSSKDLNKDGGQYLVITTTLPTKSFALSTTA